MYQKGDYVSFNHEIYMAQWWTKGEEPGNPYGPWLLQDLPMDMEWSADKVYQVGDLVYYNGETYQAKWWTLNDVPGDEFGPWSLFLPLPAR